MFFLSQEKCSFFQKIEEVGQNWGNSLAQTTVGGEPGNQSKNATVLGLICRVAQK